MGDRRNSGSAGRARHSLRESAQLARTKRDAQNHPCPSEFISSGAVQESMRLRLLSRLGIPSSNTVSNLRRSLCLSTALSCSGVASLSAAAPDLDDSIRQVRTGTLVIKAAPGAEVRVEQLRHEFWFGAALANQFFAGRDSETAARYKTVFLENFNAAVTENALKWHVMEPRQGQADYSVVDAMLAWTRQHDIPLRGHNVFWGITNRVQSWLKDMNDETLRETLKAHAQDIARRYRGRFAEYDLNNEMLHGNYYEQRLGTNITREMADWMRQEDPQAVLYLNDYDILTGRRLEDYVVHIRNFLDQGVPVGGIGVQGHLHGDTFNPVALQNALDRLATFKLPIRVTEFNFPGQRSRYYGKRGVQLTDTEEQAKAKALADYYRICFAHPAVQGILMWGFWEGVNWIPVSSLYRRDWSPTPAATAYRDLVFKQWWTNWRGQTDAQGRCEVRVFFGKHRVTAGEKEKVIELKHSERTTAVAF
jgi:endo-1,4-beta-xylanase